MSFIYIKSEELVLFGRLHKACEKLREQKLAISRNRMQITLPVLTAKILSQVPCLINLRDMLMSLSVGCYQDGELQLASFSTNLMAYCKYFMV